MARIESLRVENYRALRRLEMVDITPLTVLLGPNGSGKSTLFDVFDFLAACFTHGLRSAWDSRGRARELKTRRETKPIVIEIRYREDPGKPSITYHLALDERDGSPCVVKEWLQWTRGKTGRPFKFLDYKMGRGEATAGNTPDERATRSGIPLQSPDLIAVNALGQFAEHPRVAALRKFITDWQVSYLSVGDTRGQPEIGPQERLNRTGSNLANVIQYLKERHPARLGEIFAMLRARVPRLESVLADAMPDGRLLLQVKDAPFEQPIMARFVSDGTLKLLAYLTVLHGTTPPRFLGIEEPENFLHPRLLPELAEECRRASERSQLLATTHSPFFLNGARPEEIRVLYRNEAGHARMVRAADMPKVRQFVEAGATLGDIWLEGHFDVGDPLVRAGGPAPRRRRR